MLGQELKPCPFCGGKARIGHSPNCNDFWIICRECATYYPKDMSRKYTESEEIEAWNTRHEKTFRMDMSTYEQGGIVKCDACGKRIPTKHRNTYTVEAKYPYCPWCGAKVVEE